MHAKLTLHSGTIQPHDGIATYRALLGPRTCKDLPLKTLKASIPDAESSLTKLSCLLAEGRRGVQPEVRPQLVGAD
jgi:hypothetical protein